MLKNALQAPRLRLGLLLWLAGMLGVLATTATLIPRLLEGQDLPLPLWALTLVSLGQNGVFLALAVWAGVALAPKVGLDAPTFAAITARRPFMPALRPQLVPGVIAGLFGGSLLYAAWRVAPSPLPEVLERLSLPLYARVLYGGITEELFLRWGVMTVLLWLGWAFLQRKPGAPARRYVWLAIVLSAVLFGVGHLPAAGALAGSLNSSAIAWVVGFNVAFGLLFGYLFWRTGLESAMIAHPLAHVTNYSAEMLW